MKEGKAAQTNGQRRGNEPPSPASTLVESAAQQQYDRVMVLVEEEVHSQVSVKEKVERLGLARGRPRR